MGDKENVKESADIDYDEMKKMIIYFTDAKSEVDWKLNRIISDLKRRLERKNTPLETEYELLVNLLKDWCYRRYSRPGLVCRNCDIPECPLSGSYKGAKQGLEALINTIDNAGFLRMKDSLEIETRKNEVLTREIEANRREIEILQNVAKNSVERRAMSNRF